MPPSTITWIWLIAGLVIAMSELFIPGGVVIFIGAAAVLVAGLRALGLESLPLSFGLWFLTSISLIFTVGQFVRKHVNGEREVTLLDEDAMAFGEIVEVANAIESGQIGRIRYQGTTWKARCLTGKSIPVGAKVRLIDKDNLCWTVEPVMESLPLASSIISPSASPSNNEKVQEFQQDRQEQTRENTT